MHCFNRRLRWCDQQAWCRGWCRLIWASAGLKLRGVRNAKLGNEAQLLEFFKAYPGLRKIIGTHLIAYSLKQPEPPSLDEKTLSGHFDSVYSVSWHPMQPLLASGSGDKTVKVYDTRDWKVVKTLSDHSGGVNSVSWHPTQLLLASGSNDKTVKIYDARDWKVVKTLSDHSDSVRSVSWHPTQPLLASGSSDRTCLLYTSPSPRDS